MFLTPDRGVRDCQTRARDNHVSRRETRVGHSNTVQVKQSTCSSKRQFFFATETTDILINKADVADRDILTDSQSDQTDSTEQISLLDGLH